MKAINKFFYALLALATVGMVGCQDAQTYEPGAPEVEGCYDVYFPDAETLEAKGMTQGPTGEVELDPTEKTEFTYTAFRNNTDNDITVPVVISTNTEGKFAVSELKFEAGEDVAEFKVSLLESEIGVTYSLSLSIEDPQYVKQYESNNTNAISVDVTRVKWNNVGMCSYTDNIVTGWYSFTFSGEWAGQTHPTYDVQVQVRADSIDEAAFQAALAGTGSDAGLAGIYRLVNPYRVGPWGDPSDPSLTAVPNYIIINAEEVDKVYIPFQALGMDHIIADMTVMSEAYYQNTYASEPEDVPGMWGVIKGGTLRFEPDMLCGSPGGQYAGKIYGTNGDGAFALVLAPALGSYELAMPNAEADGDFAFESVKLPKDALFYSESQKLVSEVTLEKGKPTVDTDDADRTFVQQYGYVYRLPNLYAEGYPIYFTAALDGTLTSHPNFVEQATGLTQNGYDVYMAIDVASSTFDPETGLMNLVAEFYSYQGKYIISYGVYNEAVSVEAPDFPYAPAVDLKSDFTYSALFTDTFTSAFQASEWEATLEKGTSVAAGAEAFAAAYGTAYRIPNAYASGYDIYFAAGEDGKVVLPAGYELQATGVSIYGQQAYLQIVSGSMASNGVSFSVKVCNAAGELIMPAVCTESLVTYIWNDVQTGSFYSVLFGDPATQQIIPFTDRQLQNAEDTNIYRIVNWLDYGGNLMFTWDKTTNKCEIMGMQVTGMPASMFSGFGDVCVCDALTCLAWFGINTNWATAEKNGYTQPYFDPQTKEFVFEIFYVFPDMGVGYMLNDVAGNLPVPFTEAFVLSGEITEAKWVQVGTGSYSAPIFQDQDGNPFVAPGRVLENKENTNSYRINDWLYSEVEGINLPFIVEANNKINIQGVVDSGLPSSIFGNYQTNAYVCDVLTLYTKVLGQNVTWEALIKQYGEGIQSSYNPETKTYTFVVSYVFPADGVIVDNSFFKETYTIEQSASTSEASVRKISSERIAIKGNLEGKMTTKKALSYRVRQNSVRAEKLQPAKQTPVKRSANRVDSMTPRF